MTFSDDLKNNVNIDIDEYEQKVDTRLDELLNKYIKGNDGFLEEYYASTGVGNTDLSKIPFEEKKAILEEEFKSSDHDNNTNFYDEFQNKYEAYVVEQETGKKEVIEILLAVQKRFAQRIKTVSKKLEEASKELSEQEKQINKKEEEIKAEEEAMKVLGNEIESIRNELDKLNDEITNLTFEKEDLEAKENLSPEEEKRLEEIKSKLDFMEKEYYDKEKLRDSKVDEKKTKQDNIQKLKSEKSDLEKNHEECKKIYDDAKESLEKAKEAYYKNGEEINKVAKENGIDVEAILDEDKSKEDSSEKNKPDDKEEKKDGKDAKEAKTASSAGGVASATIPQEQETSANMPVEYSQDAMNDFVKCSNSNDRRNNYIDSPIGYANLCNSLQNRGIFDFWKNHKVKRALRYNNKEMLENMKETSEYTDLLNNALGAELSPNEKQVFEMLFDKNSDQNILNGFSKYTEQDMEDLYSVINKLNNKDFKNNPELAMKINSEIIPYIKSGVLNDFANRKVLGRFNSKHDMTGKNQHINNISMEAFNYSCKYTPVKQPVEKVNNSFTSHLTEGVQQEPTVNVPTNSEPQKSPQKNGPTR